MRKRSLLLMAIVLVGCAAEPGVQAPPPRSPVQQRRVHVEPERPLRTARSRRVSSRRAHSAVAPLVGLVASDDPDVTEALAAGARLAFAEARADHGPDLSLLVGEHEDRWGSGAASAVRMALDEGAVAVIAPPERRRAHEIAQFGTRAGVPIVSTSPAPTVTQAGSTWVISVVDTAGGVPDDWSVVGYDAGRALVEAVRRHGLHRQGLTSALAGGKPFAGASGAVWIETSGARRTP